MKIAPACYECLRGLICQAADIATNDVPLREKASKEATKILDDEFSYNQLSIVIATRIHHVIKELTHNPDPYRTMKENEMAIAQELYPELITRYTDDLEGYLKLAAAANAIDFFRAPELIKSDMHKPVRFVIDDSEYLKMRIKKASKILYLADNAGEIYFDLPLLKWMEQFAQVIYVVKPSAVQNDVTLTDIKKAGLESKFGTIMDTGIASPGIIFSLASIQFKREFASADLIFSKGMGHYESLSEFPRDEKIFYCLKAKCQPVAKSLGVPLNSYVAMLW